MREVFPFHFMCRKTSGRPALFSHLCLEGVSQQFGSPPPRLKGVPRHRNPDHWVKPRDWFQPLHEAGRDTLNKMFGCTPLYPPGPGSFDPRGIQHLTSLLPWRKLSSFRFSQGFSFTLSMFWVARTPPCCLGSSGSVSAPSRTHGHRNYGDTTNSTTAPSILKFKYKKTYLHQWSTKLCTSTSTKIVQMLITYLHQNSTIADQVPAPKSCLNSHILWLENSDSNRLLYSCPSQPVSV